MHWIDPACLPETAGVVDCFLINADGETDGFVFTDGTEVHLPPHIGEAIRQAARPGSRVRVRGVRPRHVDMIAAVSVQPEEGAAIVDNGPPTHEEARKAARKQARAARTPAEIEGVIRRILHGPKGEVRGLLLEDGRSGRFASFDDTNPVPIWRPGTAVILRGDAIMTEHGTVVSVREIGTLRGDMRRLDGKADKPKPKKHPVRGKAEADTTQTA